VKLQRISDRVFEPRAAARGSTPFRILTGAPAGKLLIVWLAAAHILCAQGLSNNSLNGRYFFRHLQIVATQPGAIDEARTLAGAINFNGSGAYTINGQLTIQTGPPAAFAGSGTYAVTATGAVTISNPQRMGAALNGRMSTAALAASSTEAGGGLFDLLVAIPAPTANVPNTALNGSWWVAGVAFPAADPAQARSTLFQLTATAGAFAAIPVEGQAAAVGPGPFSQTVTGATYLLPPDGAGSATFPLPAGAPAQSRLLSGFKTLFLSNDGNFLLMGSSEAGGHEFLVGIRASPGTSNNASLRNLYLGAGMKLDSGRFNSFHGSANSTGEGTIVVGRRVRAPDGVTAFSGVNSYSLESNGSGLVGVQRFATGINGNAFVVSGVSLTNSNNFELQFAFRAPTVAPAPGVFLHPFGAVNAASFAPVDNPLAPGTFATLFGSGLAARTETARSLPFPTTLADVQVLVNGRAAPVFLVSAGQISFLVPFATPVGEATVVVVNAGARSNQIQIPIAATSPGIFSLAQSGIGPAAVLKSNFTVVSAANPARRGDTILIYLTGLGAVNPPVADGAAASSTTLSNALAAVNVFIGGVQAEVTFKGLAPGFAGLYQINAVVPATAPGGAVPLAVETPDAFHDQVDISIAL
jgi:uncharacterized protein (TIGR03437 family)